MDEALAKVARKQWGVFSRAQAIEAGATIRTIRRRVSLGKWVEVERGVYRFPGGHETWHQKVSAATLSLPGAMASHRTAAFLWGLDGVGGKPAMIEVAAGFDVSRTLRLAKVRHTRRLPKEAAVREQIAVTPLARTLLDLSDLLTEDTLFLAFDSALRKHAKVIPQLEKELASNGPGRRNRDRLASLVKRWKGEVPTASGLEARTALALERHGTVRPTRQHNVYAPNGKFIARVDFAWIPQRVILQCDSHEWHLSPAQFEKDLLQRRQLESHGWRVVHVTSRMLATHDWLIDLDRLLEAQSRTRSLTK